MNIAAQRVDEYWPRLLEYARNARPKFGVVMDGLGRASEFYDAIGDPDAIIAHRDYKVGNVWDGEYYKKVSAKSLRDHMRKFHHDRRIWVHVLNEPQAGTYDEVQKLLDRCIEYGDYLLDDGFKVVLGNFQTLRYDENMMSSGLFDEFIAWAGKRTEEGAPLVIGQHSAYTIGFPAFGVGFWEEEEGHRQWSDASDLVNPRYAHPSMWAKSIPIRKLEETPAANGYPPYWHVGRSAWWLIRADEIGVPRHRIAETEAGMDRMGDTTEHEDRFHISEELLQDLAVSLPDFQVTNNLNHALGHLEDMYGFPPAYYSGLKGQASYRYVYEKAWRFPDTSFEDWLTAAFSWWDDTFPQEWVGWAIFTVSHGSEWQYPYGHNVMDTPGVLDNLESGRHISIPKQPRFVDEEKETITSPSPDTPDEPPVILPWSPYRITSFYSSQWNKLNVRTSPNMYANIVAVLTIGSTVYIDPLYEQIYRASHIWRRVRMEPEGTTFWIVDEVGLTNIQSGMLPSEVEILVKNALDNQQTAFDELIESILGDMISAIESHHQSNGALQAIMNKIIEYRDSTS